MAWTTISDGDRITNDAILELGVALNERLEIQGRDTKTFPDLTSGRRSEKMAEYISIIRNAIQNELRVYADPHPDLTYEFRYVSSDYEVLDSLADIFANAGYQKSSFDSKARVSDWSQWKELQDIFDSLTHIQCRYTEPVNFIDSDKGASTSSAQDAYNEAKNQPTTDDVFPEYVGYNLGKIDPEWHFIIDTPVDFILDLRNFDDYEFSKAQFTMLWYQQQERTLNSSVAFKVDKLNWEHIVDLDSGTISGELTTVDLNNITLGVENTFVLDFRDTHPEDIMIDGDYGRARMAFRSISENGLYMFDYVQGTFSFDIGDTAWTYG